MKVSLTRKLQKFIDERVKTGLYQTPSEVVREGLRLLKQRDDQHQSRLEALRTDIAIGIAQANGGHTSPLDKTTFGRIRRNGRKRLASRSNGRGKSNGI